MVLDQVVLGNRGFSSRQPRRRERGTERPAHLRSACGFRDGRASAPQSRAHADPATAPASLGTIATRRALAAGRHSQRPPVSLNSERCVRSRRPARRAGCGLSLGRAFCGRSSRLRPEATALSQTWCPQAGAELLPHQPRTPQVPQKRCSKVRTRVTVYPPKCGPVSFQNDAGMTCTLTNPRQLPETPGAHGPWPQHATCWAHPNPLCSAQNRCLPFLPPIGETHSPFAIELQGHLLRQSRTPSSSCRALVWHLPACLPQRTASHWTDHLPLNPSAWEHLICVDSGKQEVTVRLRATHRAPREVTLLGSFPHQSFGLASLLTAPFIPSASLSAPRLSRCWLLAKT